jgi:trans-2,3-dihydro-3-hydroxyanthranilate isomerase
MNSSARMLRFDVVDVFAARAFAGNPLAVVHDADGLDDYQLQTIAREFNLSETVFPLSPTRPEASYRVRIFTPTRELPFAGHPSVGVAWVLARDGVIQAGDAVQECGAGLLPVRVDAAGARIDGGAPGVGADVDAIALAEAVGLSAHDVDPNLAAGFATAGLEVSILAVRPQAVSCAVAPTLSELELPTEVLASGHVLVVAFNRDTKCAHVRMFAPGSGIAEDPATGSAALALAVFLVDRAALPPDGESAFTMFQGAEIGRPSRLDVEVVASGGAAQRTSVGGRVVAVSRGQIVIPTPQTAG